mmetsp:Transcript_12731/g.29893  ORF Transcript_12731/g.29893 Transcript_12731/m.29893 type:complete len:145 (+) Transcript_12731:1-435(+)
MLCRPNSMVFAPKSGLSAITALAPASDSKVGQLAERVSVLFAGVQQRLEMEKKETEGQLKQVGLQVEERMRIMEARMTACEERANAQERSIRDVPAAASALALREAQALVSSSLSEAGRTLGRFTVAGPPLRAAERTAAAAASA